MDLKSTKEQVEYCLENFPATRDHDLYLVMSVWKRFHKESFISFLKNSVEALGQPVPNWMYNSDEEVTMFNMPLFESIRRTRQKVQNEEKKFLPSPEIQVIRNKEEAKTRDWTRD